MKPGNKTLLCIGLAFAVTCGSSSAYSQDTASMQDSVEAMTKIYQIQEEIQKQALENMARDEIQQQSVLLDKSGQPSQSGEKKERVKYRYKKTTGLDSVKMPKRLFNNIPRRR